MRSIPDETTRAAAVKTGEVDLAYLFGGPVAEDLQRSPGVKVVAPLLYGVYWLDFLDQWDPKSPWHDRRVRLAASLAIDRKAINQAEMLGLGKPAGAFVPPEFDFALRVEAARPSIPRRAKQLLAEAGYPERLRRGRHHAAAALHHARRDGVGHAPVGGHSQPRAHDGAGHLHEHLAGEEAARASHRRHRRRRQRRRAPRALLHQVGLLRLRLPPQIDDLFQRQAKEMDRKQREALLHQIQQVVADQVLAAPIFQQGFLCAVGPRVAESALGLIQGFPYTGPARGAPAEVGLCDAAIAIPRGPPRATRVRVSNSISTWG